MPAKGQRRKQQIIDSAKDMFITNGYQSTHIGQVCDNLDIARGTVYQYFSNKRDILFAILEGVEEKLDEILDMDDIDTFYSNNPTKDKIIQFVTDRISRCINVFLKEPIVIKLIFKEINGVDEEVQTRVDKFVEYALKLISHDTQAIQKRGAYRDSVKPDLNSSFIVGAALLIMHELARQNKSTLDPEISKSIVNDYLYGVLNSSIQ